MIVKVKGIAAARLAAELMERETGRRTGWSRGDETGGIYWVCNPHLLPLGEQKVLEQIPAPALLDIQGCSHQRGQASTLSRNNSGERLKITPAIRERLLALAKEFKVTAEVDLDTLSPEPNEERLTGF